MAEIQFEKLADGTAIAYREDGGSGALGRCGFFWLGGLKSDMEGAKAETIAGLARETRRPSLRFDYGGHGRSGGLFVDGTISGWLSQSLHMFARKSRGRRIVVGSSMGGWLALLLLRKLLAEDQAGAARIAGLVLLAPACDMTADLMWSVFPKPVRLELEEKGVWMQPSAHGDPYPITARLIEDGKRHLLLRQGMDCPCPVRILQGDSDPDVPPAHALKIFEALRGTDISLTLIKGGDHRLSTPPQLALLREAALRMAERADGITV
ncbi:MAG TPA: alpha/beta fold hydrolase [Aestuariivirga sp.]|nr:alpha/beta fold hydrolase [Aestuariivirga sp.]